MIEEMIEKLKTDFPDNTVAQKFEEKLTKAWEVQEGKASFSGPSSEETQDEIAPSDEDVQ